MTLKKTQTILFAGLIAAMILPFSGMNYAQGEIEISDSIVSERNFKSDNHRTFQEYIDLPREDNAWNKAMIKQTIRNYNIETKMGDDVDGYEILALHAQKQIMKNKQPSLATEKLFEWVLAKYDVPDNKKDIKSKLTDLVGKENVGDAKKLAKSIVRLAELGVVSVEIHQADPIFWNAIITDSYCDMTDNCGPQTGTLSNVMFNEASIVNVGYVDHFASIVVIYEYCEAAGIECTEFRTHNGSSSYTTNIGAPGHIGDPYLYVYLTVLSDGDNVYASAQITSPTSGTKRVASDDDGYAYNNGNISNPSYGAWTLPNVEFVSYATP